MNVTTASKPTLQPTHIMQTVSSMCSVVHSSFWHWGLMKVQNNVSNNKKGKQSTHTNNYWVTKRQKSGTGKG